MYKNMTTKGEIYMRSAKEYIQSVFETVKARNGHEATPTGVLKNFSALWSLS